jgi:hypothetical protein
MLTDNLYLSSKVKANGLFHCKSPVDQPLQQHLRNVPYSTYIGIQTVLTVGNVLKTRSRSACAAAKPSFPSESKTFVSIRSSSSCGGTSTHTSRCAASDMSVGVDMDARAPLQGDLGKSSARRRSVRSPGSGRGVDGCPMRRCHGNDRVSVRRAVPAARRHACTACAPGSDSRKVRWRVVSAGGARRARTGTLYWGVFDMDRAQLRERGKWLLDDKRSTGLSTGEAGRLGKGTPQSCNNA